MKKLKKIWQENSVLFVLLSILIVCLIAILIVVFTYFVGGSKSKFGDRLDEIDKYPFGEVEIGEITSKIKEDEMVEEVKISVNDTRRIIIDIKYTSKATLVQAQSKSLETLDYFSEETQSYYDLTYNIYADATEKSDGFKISGSHNVSGTGGIVWNNNTKFEKNEE